MRWTFLSSTLGTCWINLKVSSLKLFIEKQEPNQFTGESKYFHLLINSTSNAECWCVCRSKISKETVTNNWICADYFVIV